MRGLPGSGKSFLAKQITQRYRCSNIVCSADHYFMLQDGKYSHEQTKLGEAHKYCQETCKKAMVIEKKHIVIDNCNIQRFEIQNYFNLAKANNYLTLIVEPQTSWKFDIKVLAANNIHRCSPDYIEGKKSQYIDIQPKYWALFLNEQDSKCIRFLARSHFFECLSLFPVFAKNFSSSCPNSLYEHYYNIDTNKILHCTMCFITPNNCSYSSEKLVLQSVGKYFKLQISGFIFTPRVTAAVIKLRKSQLKLWKSEDNFSYVKDKRGCLIASKTTSPLPENNNYDAPSCHGERSITESIISNSQLPMTEFSLKQEADDLHIELERCERPIGEGIAEDPVVTMQKGSRAHLTVGCHDSVDNVQSGYDLLDLKHRFEEGHFKEIVYQKDFSFIDYGDAGCEVQFDWPMPVGSLFAGYYGCS